MWIAAVALVATGLQMAPAGAEDFFSALFGGFMSPPPAARGMVPFDGFGNAPQASRPRTASGGGRQAFCVRTCDGRYFPLVSGSSQSRAESCSSLCPASETKVFYGGNIDHATSEGGKSYTSLANAFRYRNEIVAGCTCNGKDSFGLAHVDIKDDVTLRKGDIVASEQGLLVAGGKPDRRGGALNFSPASAAVVARFSRAPVVASE